jgi:hypothetical protein
MSHVLFVHPWKSSYQRLSYVQGSRLNKSITTPDAISAHAKLVEHPLETYFCPMDKN